MTLTTPIRAAFHVAIRRLRLIFLVALVFLVLAGKSLYAQQNSFRLWGVTTGDEDFAGYGGIYSLNPDGSDFQLHKSFASNPDGSRPLGRILKLNDGTLMGMTAHGGVHDMGVIYKMNADGTGYNKVFDFNPDAGFNPSGRLIQGADGFVYGAARSWYNGGGGTGAIFKINADGSNFVKLFQFDPSVAAVPWGGLLQASDGKLYGTTAYGTSTGLGTVYRINTDGTGFQRLHVFSGSGAYPKGELIEGSDGFLYGMTEGGTATGTLFKIKRDGTGFEYIHLFGQGNDGRHQGAILQLTDGNIIGISPFGGNNDHGVLFKVKPDGSDYIILHHFTQELWQSSIGLTSTGKIYSLSRQSLFTIETDGTGLQFISLDQFINPGQNADVLETAPGTFIVVMETGGAAKEGAIFKITGTTVTPLKVFEQEGADPQSSLILGSNGSLYGRTLRGGTKGNGTIFSIAKDGSNFITLHSVEQVSAPPHQLGSRGTLVEVNGFLYGTTLFSLFKMDIDGGNFSIVTQLGEAQDQALGDVCLGPDGFIYGLLGNTFDNTKGKLYKVRPNGTEYSVVLDLANTAAQTGTHPSGLRIIGSDMYLITTRGGASSSGVISKVSLDGSLITPIKALSFELSSIVSRYVPMLASDGKLYGKAQHPNAYFSVRPDGTDFAVNPSTTATGGFGSLVEGLPGMIFSGSYDKIHKFTVASGSIQTIYSGTPDFKPSAGLTVLQKQPQTVLLPEIPSKQFGDAAFTVTATSDLSLPITYSSSNVAVATVSGNTVTIVGAGTAMITARQAGTITVSDASAERTLTVAKAPQQITFNAIADRTVGVGSLSLAATSSSGLPVSFTSSSSKVTINGNSLTTVTAGRAAVSAQQAGNANYLAAVSVENSFCINPAKPVISTSGLGTESVVLTSSNTVGNQWLLGGTAISGAISSNFNVAAAGVYTVKTTVDDCSSLISEPVNIIVTGLQVETLTGLNAYPNPVQGEVFVELVAADHADVVFEIFDGLGRRVSRTNGSTNTLTRISMEDQGMGMYFLKALSNEKIHTSRIVKK